jgi:hypothetical protein
MQADDEKTSTQTVDSHTLHTGNVGVIIPCSVARDHRRFTTTYCFHFHENRTMFLRDVGNHCHIKWCHTPQNTILNLRSQYVVEQQLSRYGDGLDGRGSFPNMAKFFSSPQRPYRLWGPPSLLSSGYRGLFPLGLKGPGSEADHSPPSSVEVKMAWCLLKHRNDFAFTTDVQ